MFSRLCHALIANKASRLNSFIDFAHIGSIITITVMSLVLIKLLTVLSYSILDALSSCPGIRRGSLLLVILHFWMKLARILLSHIHIYGAQVLTRGVSGRLGARLHHIIEHVLAWDHPSCSNRVPSSRSCIHRAMCGLAIQPISSILRVTKTFQTSGSASFLVYALKTLRLLDDYVVDKLRIVDHDGVVLLGTVCILSTALKSWTDLDMTFTWLNVELVVLPCLILLNLVYVIGCDSILTLR